MKRTRTRNILWFIVLLGAVLRLYRLGHQSLWYDELFTVLVAKRPFPEMLNRLITGDVHPPLYYIFEHALMQMGTAEIMARFVPLIFSILSVPLFYRLARLWLGATGALVAVGLLAVSPFHVLFAQEARMYAMLGFWVLGMVYFFQQAWRNGRTRDWSFFALFLTLSLYTHNLAFLYLLAIDLYALLTGIRRRWRPFLAAHTAAFIALSPWVWVWISQVERVQAGFWALPPSPLGLFLAIYLVLFGPSAPPWLAPMGLTAVLLLLAFIASKVVRNRLLPNGLFLAACLFLVPLFVLYGLAFIRPVFVERIFLPASFGLYVWLAWGILHVPPHWLNRLAGSVLLLVMAISLVNYDTNPDVQKPPFRALAAQVAAQVQTGDVVIHTSDSSALAFAWYAPELSPAISSYLAGDPDFEQMTARAYGGLAAGLRPLPPEKILSSAHRIWLVVALDHNNEYQLAQVDWFDKQYTRQDHQIVGNMDILRYDVEP